MLLSKENITLVNLLLIQQTFGAGSIKAVKIFNILRDAYLLDCDFTKDNLSVLEQKDSNKILSFDKNKIYKIIEDCQKNNILIVTICDINYPDRLRNIVDCPLAIYVKGEFLNVDETPLVSVVGPRKISDFGKKASLTVSGQLQAESFALAFNKVYTFGPSFLAFFDGSFFDISSIFLSFFFFSIAILFFWD